MTAPANAADIARQLGALARELDVVVGMLETAERDSVDSRHAADLREAHVYLTSEGSVEFRKRTAFESAEELIHRAEVAEALVRHLKRRLDATKVRIDVGRSYGAALRAEISLGGGPS